MNPFDPTPMEQRHQGRFGLPILTLERAAKDMDKTRAQLMLITERGELRDTLMRIADGGEEQLLEAVRVLIEAQARAEAEAK